MTRRTVVLSAVVLGLGLAAPAAPEPVVGRDLTGFVAPYLRARDGRIVGDVLGHATGDAAHPSAPPVPYEGVSVLLLPQSANFEDELAAIKAHLRDSLTAYMSATADVTGARETYERALLAAGAGELIRGEVSDAQGQVRLVGVPVGDWSLLAWRSVAHPGKAPKLPGSDRTGFRDLPVSTGYSTVTYWFLALSVRASEITAIDLNDRNVWLTGIHEDIQVIEGAPKKKGTTKWRP